MHLRAELYARGPYRLLDDPEAPAHRRFVVLDAAGAWQCEEAQFELARAWIDQRVPTLDAPRHVPSPSRSR